MPQLREHKPTELDTAALFKELADASPRAACSKIFEAVTHIDPYDLEEIMLKRKPVPAEVSARGIMRNLAKLLDLRVGEVAAILDVSESRVSRNHSVSIRVLDRTYGISEVFAQVSAVLGPSHARAWFKEPNLAFDGELPYKLVSTRYGEKKVENLVTALLNGAVV